jgi:hypothetical protein
MVGGAAQLLSLGIIRTSMLNLFNFLGKVVGIIFFVGCSLGGIYQLRHPDPAVPWFMIPLLFILAILGLLMVFARPYQGDVAPVVDAFIKRAGGESKGNVSKWWYFALPGVCIIGYSIWQAYGQHSIKPFVSLLPLAVLFIGFGIWKWNKKTDGRP